MKANKYPAQEYLRECFDYDPKVGNLTWRVRPPEHFPTQRGMRVHHSRFAGKVAGTLHGEGYWQIILNMKMYLEHRLVWIWLHGSHAEGLDVDHINRVRLDNRECNLRLATRSENLRNVERERGVSPLMGASFDKRRKKKPWYSRIRVNGKSVQLGRFKTAEEAHEAYKAAAISLHNGFSVLSQ